jgi:hypothetical protein
MRLAAQGMHNDIRLSRMVMDLQIIILDQLHPPSLAHVQIQLGKHILQALMVSGDMDHIPKNIMPPYVCKAWTTTTNS